MKEEIKLHITTKQFFEKGVPSETFSYKAEGRYFFRNPSHYLLYEEKLEGYKNPFQTRVKFKNGVLELQRKGDAEILMTFEEGKSYVTEYTTPFGKMLLEITTGKLQVIQKEDLIQIKIDYSMKNEDTKISDNIMELRITER